MCSRSGDSRRVPAESSTLSHKSKSTSETRVQISRKTKDGREYSRVTCNIPATRIAQGYFIGILPEVDTQKKIKKPNGSLYKVSINVSKTHNVSIVVKNHLDSSSSGKSHKKKMKTRDGATDFLDVHCNTLTSEVGIPGAFCLEDSSIIESGKEQIYNKQRHCLSKVTHGPKETTKSKEKIHKERDQWAAVAINKRSREYSGKSMTVDMTEKSHRCRGRHSALDMNKRRHKEIGEQATVDMVEKSHRYRGGQSALDMNKRRHKEIGERATVDMAERSQKQIGQGNASATTANGRRIGAIVRSEEGNIGGVNISALVSDFLTEKKRRDCKKKKCNVKVIEDRIEKLTEDEDDETRSVDIGALIDEFEEWGEEKKMKYGAKKDTNENGTQEHHDDFESVDISALVNDFLASEERRDVKRKKYGIKKTGVRNIEETLEEHDTFPSVDISAIVDDFLACAGWRDEERKKYGAKKIKNTNKEVAQKEYDELKSMDISVLANDFLPGKTRRDAKKVKRIEKCTNKMIKDTRGDVTQVTDGVEKNARLSRDKNASINRPMLTLTSSVGTRRNEDLLCTSHCGMESTSMKQSHQSLKQMKTPLKPAKPQKGKRVSNTFVFKTSITSATGVDRDEGFTSVEVDCTLQSVICWQPNHKKHKAREEDCEMNGFESDATIKLFRTQPDPERFGW